MIHQYIKDKLSNLPTWAAVVLVLLAVFIPLLLFEAIQKSDNESVRDATIIRMHDIYTAKLDSMQEVIDSLESDIDSLQVELIEE